MLSDLGKCYSAFYILLHKRESSKVDRMLLRYRTKGLFLWKLLLELFLKSLQLEFTVDDLEVRFGLLYIVISLSAAPV